MIKKITSVLCLSVIVASALGLSACGQDSGADSFSENVTEQALSKKAKRKL